MKTSTKLFMASCCALISSSALAVDGTIDITGTVTDSSCTIALDGGAASGSVVLPTVSATSLASEGTVAGATPFTFNLSGCPTTGATRAFFESTNVDQSTGFLANNSATPAGNVQVQVADVNGAAIDLRDQTNNPFVSFDASGNANLTYNAQYVAVGGGATAGEVETQLVYTLEYN